MDRPNSLKAYYYFLFAAQKRAHIQRTATLAKFKSIHANHKTENRKLQNNKQIRLIKYPNCQHCCSARLLAISMKVNRIYWNWNGKKHPNKARRWCAAHERICFYFFFGSSFAAVFVTLVFTQCVYRYTRRWWWWWSNTYARTMPTLLLYVVVVAGIYGPDAYL